MTDKIQYVTKYPKPKNLNPEAERMWNNILSTYELRPDECRLVVDIVREIDIINRITRELEGAPAMVKGSMGQEVANPLFSEARQHRLALASLFKQLGLEKRQAVGAKSDRQKNADAVVEAANRWRKAGNE